MLIGIGVGRTCLAWGEAFEARLDGLAICGTAILILGVAIIASLSTQFQTIPADGLTR